jgi:uncharacterized membrane protein YobD (UPF0266 family)
MKKESIKNHLLKDIKVSTIYSGIKKTQNNEDDLLLIELKKNQLLLEFLLNP